MQDLYLTFVVEQWLEHERARAATHGLVPRREPARRRLLAVWPFSWLGRHARTDRLGAPGRHAP